MSVRVTYISRKCYLRTREEVQEVRAKQDPIGQLKEKLIGSGLSDAEELKVKGISEDVEELFNMSSVESRTTGLSYATPLQEIEVSIKKAVDAEVKKAKADPEIGVEELYNDTYEQNLGGDIRGLLPWEKHPHKKTQTAINL